MKIRSSLTAESPNKKKGVRLITSVSAIVLVVGLTAACGIETKQPENTEVRNPIEEYESPDEAVKHFLNSEDGKVVQETAKAFSQAYLSGERSVVEKHVASSQIQGIDENALKNPYSVQDIDLRVLKIDPDRLAADSVSAQYEVRLAGDPAYRYVDLQMVKSEEGWKVQSYGLES